MVPKKKKKNKLRLIRDLKTHEVQPTWDMELFLRQLGQWGLGLRLHISNEKVYITSNCYFITGYYDQ